MNPLTLKIAIAEPSVIIRSGLTAAFKRVQGVHIQTFEIASYELLLNYIKLHKPDILVVNPVFWGQLDLSKLKESGKSNMRCIALVSGMFDESLLRIFDDKIGIYDSIDQIKQKLDNLFHHQEETATDTETLSQREKEILVCVVKGLTNKEIAQTLFLSTHTVISHRRNIARKLEIHSTAGLTIYAIVNKLVELDEIKNDI